MGRELDIGFGAFNQSDSVVNMLHERAVVGDGDLVPLGDRKRGTVNIHAEHLRCTGKPDVVAVKRFFDEAAFFALYRFLGAHGCCRGTRGIGGLIDALDLLWCDQTARAVMDRNESGLVRNDRKGVFGRLLSRLAALNGPFEFRDVKFFGKLLVKRKLLFFGGNNDLIHAFGLLKGEKGVDDNGNAVQLQHLLGDAVTHAARASARDDDRRGEVAFLWFSKYASDDLGNFLGKSFRPVHILSLSFGDHSFTE